VQFQKFLALALDRGEWPLYLFSGYDAGWAPETFNFWKKTSSNIG